MSLLAPEATDDVPAGRLLDQAVIVSPSTPTDGPAASPATRNTTNLSDTPLQPMDAALSNSGTEDATSSAGLVSPPSSISATVQNQSPASSLQTKDGSAVQAALPSNVGSEAEDLASTSPGQPSASAMGTSAPRGTGAHDDGSAAPQAGSTELDDPTATYAPAVQSASSTGLSAVAQTQTGAGGAGPVTGAPPPGSMFGPSGRPGPAASTEELVAQVFPSHQATQQDIATAGITMARSSGESDVPLASDPGRTATASFSLKVAESCLGDNPGAAQAPASQQNNVAHAREPATAETAIEVPRPTQLLTNFLPFDQATVETAVDTFLEQLVDMRSDATSTVDLGRLVTGIAVVAAVTTASSVMLRRYRNHTRKPESIARSQAVLDLFKCPNNLWKMGEI